MAVRILLVDDSASFRRSAVELLTSRGFAVLPSAADRVAALDVVAMGGCPDAVFVDVQLSSDDGIAAAEALATRCPEARVVLLAAPGAQIPDADRERARAVAVLAKDRLPDADLDALLDVAAESS
jgi:CheY-like chemotaxis protein